MLKWFKMRHYWSILLSQVFLLFLSAFLGRSIIVSLLFVFCLLGILGAVIETIWERRLPRVLALVSGLIALVAGVLHYLPGVTQTEVAWFLFVGCVAYAVFVVIAIFSISRYVFIADRITTNRIVGSICIYMLIGIFFAFVYAAMALVINNSFNIFDAVTERHEVYFSDFLYFSYATLTTIGYGDMTPTHPITKMTSSLEGVTGCIYLTIMVARLVGMHITQWHHERKT